MMTFELFCQLAADYNLIPVYRREIADIDTPVSVLAKLTAETNVFLLESVENSEQFGRYSFIGLNPRAIFTVEHNQPFYQPLPNGEKTLLPSPNGAFMALRELLKSVSAPELPELPPLFGGAVGFMGYEIVNQFETLPAPKATPPVPEAAFMLTDEMIIFDNQKHIKIFSICVRPAEFSSLRAAYDYAQQRLTLLSHKISRPASVTAAPQVTNAQVSLTPEMSRDDYMAKVQKARQYIHDGELIQLVLSQRFSGELSVDPLQLYRALRLVNPSPYTFYMKLGDNLLIGSSPETLCKLDHQTATLRPIAGTRKRGINPAEDRRLADELLSDPKERAEHLMLVDLGRNDLGRIAAPGSVQLKNFMTVERYSHVMHLVSTIEAMPNPGIDAFDLIKAAFPAGTLSGAPKVRAMQLIHELEESPRGAYGGAMGYFSYSHNMDLAITIRTFEIRHGQVTVQAGAGIVFDSDPACEYEETCNKAAALMKALKLAANKLIVEE